MEKRQKTIRIPLRKAEKYAGQIIAPLAPLCERIQIAGSIRRQRPNVGDIDIVCIPKNILALKKRCSQKAQITENGFINFKLQLETGLKVEIYMASARQKDLFKTTPSTWGTILLSRTGSKAHNIKLANRARDLFMHWNPYQGLFDAAGTTLIASETEEEIYQALKMGFVSPENRE